MKKSARVLAVAAVFLVSGCSGEMAKRSAYESMQNMEQMNCQQRPGSNCPEKQSYDDYQRSLNKRGEPGK